MPAPNPGLGSNSLTDFGRFADLLGRVGRHGRRWRIINRDHLVLHVDTLGQDLLTKVDLEIEEAQFVQQHLAGGTGQFRVSDIADPAIACRERKVSHETELLGLDRRNPPGRWSHLHPRCFAPLRGVAETEIQAQKNPPTLERTVNRFALKEILEGVPQKVCDVAQYRG